MARWYSNFPVTMYASLAPNKEQAHEIHKERPTHRDLSMLVPSTLIQEHRQHQKHDSEILER